MISPEQQRNDVLAQLSRAVTHLTESLAPVLVSGAGTNIGYAIWVPGILPMLPRSLVDLPYRITQSRQQDPVSLAPIQKWLKCFSPQ